MRITTTLITIFVLLLFFLSPLSGQSQVSPQEVQQEVDKMFASLEGQLSPGSAVLVVKDKETILNKGYGYANLEAKSPITPETRFDLASVAKQFAGYAIALLVEQGELSETDEVRQYIPEFPDFDQTITIGHLLHHTSGLRDWTSMLPLTGRSFDDVISMDHILRMVYQQKGLNFEPGSEYTYSNTGYNILAEIVQRVSGMSFREWTDKNIFQPLGMEHTFFLDDHQEVIPNRAHSYFKRKGSLFREATNLLTALGSSSLYSSTADLLLWVNHLLDPAAEFKPAVDRMLQTEPLNDGKENNYAYGISMRNFRGTDWISHSGSWAAFRTYLVLLPAYDLAIVVLNNNDQSAYRTASRIASLYVPEPEIEESDESVADAEEVALSKQALDEFTGTYRLGKTWYVHLTRDGDKLWTQATGEDKFPMKAIADSVFLIEDYGNRPMTFQRNEKGEVTQMIYSDMVCPKLSSDIQPSLKKPEQMVGHYYSDELDLNLKVAYTEGSLILWQFDQGHLPLIQAWGDDFQGPQWYINSVEFQRNDTGKVEGLSVTSHRARNLFFKKLE